MADQRTARLKRNTTETQIELALSLDGTGQAAVNTGIPFLDQHFPVIHDKDGKRPVQQPFSAARMQEKVKLLTQYKQLLDSGILTQEEFDKLKAETLGKQ